MITEVADGFLAHRHTDADGKMHMHFNVNFHTNEDLSLEWPSAMVRALGRI